MNREEELFRRANSRGETLRERSVCRVGGVSRAVKNSGESLLRVESRERGRQPRAHTESAVPAVRFDVDEGRTEEETVRGVPIAVQVTGAWFGMEAAGTGSRYLFKVKSVGISDKLNVRCSDEKGSEMEEST